MIVEGSRDERVLGATWAIRNLVAHGEPVRLAQELNAYFESDAEPQRFKHYLGISIANSCQTDSDLAAKILNLFTVFRWYDLSDMLLRPLLAQDRTARLLILAGNVRRETDDLDAAVACWAEACEIDPKNREAKLLLLSRYAERDRLSDPMAQRLIDELRVDEADISLSGTDLNSAHLSARLERYRCCLLRGLFAADAMTELHRRFTDNLTKSEAAIKPYVRDAWSAVYPLFYCSGDARQNDFLQRSRLSLQRDRIVDLLYATPKELATFSDVIIDPLLESSFKAGIDNFVGHDARWWPDYSMARLISAAGTASGISHQDGRLQVRMNRFVTCWIPFSPCGGNRSPSLGVVPIPMENFFPVDPGSVEVARNAIAPPLYLTPEFEPGDVLVHTNLSIHKSHLAPEMRGVRTSVDVRFS